MSSHAYSASEVNPPGDVQPDPRPRITVVVDPTEQAQPAVDKAVRVAVASGATLEFYVCDEDQGVPESWAGPLRAHEYRAIRGHRMLEEMRRLAAPYKAQGLQIDLASEWHAPLEEGIGHHVIRSMPSLVVKSTRRHPATPRVALTRTDWNLIRQIPAPLLLVGERPWGEVPRIAAAVGPCHAADHPADLDAAIVAGAQRLAGAVTGSVEIYHVLQTPPHLPGEPVSPQLKALVHAGARKAVERLAGRMNAAATRVTAGRVVEGLAQLVEAHAPDVLVMGAVARPRWVHSAARGTAAQLLERVDCDLLVVKPAGFISPLMVTED